MRDASFRERFGLRNAILSVSLCVLMGAPFALVFFERCGVLLPLWLTSEDANYLAGGISETDLFKPHDVSYVLDGGFQADFEAEVGNYIPAKAFALLGYARLQREAIGISNLIWRWSCYPTMYGGEYLYVPSEKSIVQMPHAAGYESDVGLENFANGLDSVAESWGGVKFVCYFAARSESASSNPARSLVSCSSTVSSAASAVARGAEGNAQMLYDDPSDLESYYESFYRSDHHWNARGAAKAYDQIAEALGRKRLGAGAGPVCGPPYAGSYARRSLCVVEDVPLKMTYDFNGVWLGGDVQEKGNAHKTYSDASVQDRHWMFYDKYYRFFDHAEGIGLGRVLLVCDSYGLSLIRPLAVGFERVDCVYALHASSKTNRRLGELIKKKKPDAVVFVGCPENYSSFCKRNPRFFE